MMNRCVKEKSLNQKISMLIACWLLIEDHDDEVEQVGEGRFPAPPLRLRVEGGGGEGGEGPVPRHDEGPVLPKVSRAGQVSLTARQTTQIGADIDHWNCQPLGTAALETLSNKQNFKTTNEN